MQPWWQAAGLDCGTVRKSCDVARPRLLREGSGDQEIRTTLAILMALTSLHAIRAALYSSTVKKSALRCSSKFKTDLFLALIGSFGTLRKLHQFCIPGVGHESSMRLDTWPGQRACQWVCSPVMKHSYALPDRLSSSSKTNGLRPACARSLSNPWPCSPNHQHQQRRAR